MNYILNYWWVWGLSFVICIALGLGGQIFQMVKLGNSSFRSFAKRSVLIAIPGLLASIFGILFVIAILMKLIEFYKKQ